MANTIKFGNGQWATKKDSILAFNDENANFKPLPFVASRASTATRINKEGLIETVGVDVPRVDYLNNPKGAYLLEPQSTNLVIGSAEGNYGNFPASSTNIISPDGTNNAYVPLISTASNRYEESIPAGTYLTGQKLTYSWYRKRISTPIGDNVLGDLNIKQLVNLTELEVSNARQIQSDINGFDRFEAVVQVINGSLASTFRAYFGSVVGVGNSSVAYWGHQLEEGSYATSYIPTLTGSSQTRLAETANGAGNASTFNDSEGVLFFEASALSNGGRYMTISINDGTSSNHISFLYRTQLNQVWMQTSGSGSDTNIIILDVVQNINNKIALSYSANGIKIFINGLLKGSLAFINALPIGLNSVEFNNGAQGETFYGKVKDLRVYKTALTDSELQTLTTI